MKKATLTGVLIGMMITSTYCLIDLLRDSGK